MPDFQQLSILDTRRLNLYYGRTLTARIQKLKKGGERIEAGALEIIRRRSPYEYR
jgi:hypothetical protein